MYVFQAFKSASYWAMGKYSFATWGAEIETEPEFAKHGARASVSSFEKTEFMGGRAGTGGQ